MTYLSVPRLLPKPKQTETVFASSYDDDDLAAALALVRSFVPQAVCNRKSTKNQAKQKRKAEIPPYGQRAGSGWVPRAPEDWGDGGAYPEIHTVQFPLNMGKPRGNVTIWSFSFVSVVLRRRYHRSSRCRNRLRCKWTRRASCDTTCLPARATTSLASSTLVWTRSSQRT